MNDDRPGDPKPDINPGSPGVALTGMTLMNVGKRQNPRALLGLLRTQLQRNPRTPALLLKAADTALLAEEWLEAVDYAREVVLATGDARAMAILVDALFQLGRQPDLDALWDRLAPSLSPWSHDAGASTQSVEADNPVNRIRMRLAQHLMKRGDLAEGMALRHRLNFMKTAMQHPLARNPAIPWWSPRHVGRPLLVISEQGLGEQILWAAAFDELAAKHPGSVVECSVGLLPVFRRSFPQLAFVSYESGELQQCEGIEYTKIMASGLDHALGMRTRIACPTAWLRPDEEKVGELRGKYLAPASGARLVGLSWRSHHPHYGSYKSIPLELFGSLLRTPGCEFVSLQYGDVAFDLKAAAAAGVPAPRVDASIDAMSDLDTWIAQVAAMDIVVTTSNTTAHTAAALGRPTILLLPSPLNVFYYWGYTGRKTPWYPRNLEIIRANDDRPAVVEAARQALLGALPGDAR